MVARSNPFEFLVQLANNPAGVLIFVAVVLVGILVGAVLLARFGREED